MLATARGIGLTVGLAVAGCNSVLGIHELPAGPDAGGSDTAPGCDPGYSACGSKCLPTTSDSNNCGSCGRSCQGLSCTMSMCQTITLTPGLPSPWGIAVDTTQVYFTTATEVMSVPLGGGTPTPLATGNGLYGLALHGTSVYWADLGAGTVSSVPTAGGMTALLASAQGGPWAVAVDASAVYWTDHDAGTVMKLSGSQVIPLATGQDAPSGIAVDANNVYWTNNANPGAVMSVPLGGGTPTALAANQNSPLGIAVDGANVYWANNADSGAGAVMSIPLRGGAGPNPLAPGESAPWGVVVDGTHVYWTTSATHAAVRKVSIGGGPPTTLASESGPLRGLTVDATYVYWANWDLGVVSKVVK